MNVFYNKLTQRVNTLVPLMLKKPIQSLYTFKSNNFSKFNVSKKDGGELTIDRSLSSQLYKEKMSHHDPALL